MKKTILIAALGLFSLSVMAQDAKPEDKSGWSEQRQLQPRKPPALRAEVTAQAP